MAKTIKDLEKQIEQLKAEKAELEVQLEEKNKLLAVKPETDEKISNTNKLIAYRTNRAVFNYKNSDGVLHRLNQGTIIVLSQKQFDTLDKAYGFVPGTTKSQLLYSELSPVEIFFAK